MILLLCIVNYEVRADMTDIFEKYEEKISERLRESLNENQFSS